MMKRIFAGLCLVTLMAFQAMADTRTLNISGTGVATAVPDTGVISLGVETIAETAQAALNENSALMTRVLEAARAAGIADRDMATATVSLYPQFDSSSSSRSERRISGYQASNTVRLTVRDLPDMGNVIDALAKAGGNSIGGISFRVDDTTAMLRDARRAAVADAMDKASLYADAAGVTLGPVLMIREPGVTQGPQPLAARMAEAAPVAIAPGETSVTATIEIVFALTEPKAD